MSELAICLVLLGVGLMICGRLRELRDSNNHIAYWLEQIARRL